MIRQGTRNLKSTQVADLRHAFSLIKAESDELLAENPDGIFVPTEAYRGIITKPKSLVVGRKGVGKSAVVRTCTNLGQGKFSQTFALQADNLIFERICSLLLYGKDTHADLNVESDRVAAVAWIRSLVLFATLHACEELINHSSGAISQSDTDSLMEARSFINGEFSPSIGNSPSNANGRIQSLLERILILLSSHSVKSGSDEAPPSTGAQLRNFYNPIPDQLRQALGIIQRSGYTALITFDEFDDFIDSYLAKHTTIERRETLTDLFKGLVLAVKRLNSERHLKWLHLLIAVPEDKLLELKLREGAVVDQFTYDITWSPDELKECVERRFTHVLGVPTKWEDLFNFLVSNKNHLVRIKEDSFDYVVRHTHRKPREIMAYLEALFARIETSKKAADDYMFQKVVESTTEKIVERQFLPEYTIDYPNLDSLLTRFRAARLRSVMGYSDFLRYVTGWNPWGKDSDPLNPLETLLRLFHMGIIGLREVCEAPTARTVRQAGLNVIYHFSFNGTSASFLRGAVKAMADDTTLRAHAEFDFVFSPLFFEYLRLKHDQSFIVNEIERID